MTNNLLDVGDELIESEYSYLQALRVITRVTAKRAFARVDNNYEICFEREVKGWMRQYGGGDWNSKSYQLATPELKSKLSEIVLREKLRARLNKVDVNKFPIETVKQVLRLIDEFVKH